MSKVFVPVLTLNVMIFRLVARVRKAFENCVPLGYEDETGFHFGQEETAGQSPVSYPVPQPKPI